MSLTEHANSLEIAGVTGHSPAREIVEFRVPKQQLHNAQILCAPIDQRRFGSPHRVRAVVGWIESEGLDPGLENSSVLPCSQVWRIMNSTGKHEVVRL